ncbi:MAG: tetratricopeptide repeat protein [Pseudomonadales bacterium]
MKIQLKNTRKATLVSLCIAGAFGFSGANYASTDEITAEKFELKFFKGTLAASHITSGDYAQAIKKLDTITLPRFRYMQSTNLCVAHTSIGDYAEAEKHCQKAKHISIVGRSSAPWQYADTKKKEATASNNLGVLRALQGRREEALEYFTTAQRKSKEFAKTSERNIGVLEKRSKAEFALTL